MSFLKAQVTFPSNVASIFSAIKHNTPILFLAQTLYTLFNRSPLMCKFLRFQSAWVKIHQIPHVNFELTSQFLFIFCIILHCHDKNSPVNFKHIHFPLWIKGSHQSPNFQAFKCSGKNLPNSSSQFLEAQASFPSKLLCTFLAETLYTLVKISSLKCNFLRFLSAWVNIY